MFHFRPAPGRPTKNPNLEEIKFITMATNLVKLVNNPFDLITVIYPRDLYPDRSLQIVKACTQHRSQSPKLSTTWQLGRLSHVWNSCQ